MKKNILLALGFEPTTFRLMSSCLGITLFTWFALPIFVASTLVYPRTVTKTIHMVTVNIIQGQYI